MRLKVESGQGGKSKSSRLYVWTIFLKCHILYYQILWQTKANIRSTLIVTAIKVMHKSHDNHGLHHKGHDMSTMVFAIKDMT